jgi:RHS repeat-associated protein
MKAGGGRSGDRGVAPSRPLAVGLVLAAALGLPSALDSAPALTALAPVEILLDGQRELVGVAITADGVAYVSDYQLGAVLRLAPSGQLGLAVGGLDRPAGLALDADGRLLVAEEHGGRVLRLEPSGALTTLAGGLRKPRWLAVAPDGGLYVTAHRPALPDGAEPEEGQVIVRRDPATGTLEVVASALRKLEGLAVNGDALYAAARLVEPRRPAVDVVVRYPLEADGQLGPPASVVDGGVRGPEGLVLDRLGALYVTSREVGRGASMWKQAVAKVHPDGRLTVLAEELDDPRGIALGPDGSLWVADGRAGRLVRFRAPPAPTLAVPEFTNQSPVLVTGATETGARVALFVGDAGPPLVAIAGSAGEYSLAVPLAPDAAGVLEAFATTHSGDGLTSAPTAATVTHDAVAPGLAFQAPPALAHVRSDVAIAAHATDTGSGVASLALSAGVQPLAAALAPPPPAPAVTASAVWDTRAASDGAVGLTAVATDRAGNAAAVQRGVIVDNTPPDTHITAGPTGEIATTSATFGFGGTDNLTPPESLRFAWRLDGGPFTAFMPATTAALTDLAEGPHTFEVVARDLAGNEDPSPAARSFTVRLGPSITAVDPASGPAGTFVTITGARFEPGATHVAFDGVAAVVRTIDATTLTTTVPPDARAGPVGVTTPRGTATHPFTVAGAQDFTLTVGPPTGPVLQGAATTFTVELDAAAGAVFTGLATLALDPLTPGLHAVLGTPALGGGQRGTVTVTADSAATLGATALTVRATVGTASGTVTRTATTTVAVLPGGRTALLGRVTFANGAPIAGVHLRLAGIDATTDAAGNFLFLEPPAGPQLLEIDADAATSGLPLYGVEVTLTAGQATELPPLRITPPPPAERFTPIANAAADQVITDPRFPGVSITLPKGATIVGWDGQPKTRIALERLSPEALPVPPPPGFTRSLYQVFFGTPMGGLPSSPLPVTLPNDQDLAPGEQVELWYYDAAPLPGVPAGWRRAGTGTVTDDGTTVVADAGVGLQRFCGVCGLFCILRAQAGQANPNPQGPTGGDPVDLGTGLMLVSKTDLVLPGRLPAVVRRHFNPLDAFGRVAGFELPTGPGWALSVDVVLLEESASLRRLILPGNARFAFARQPDGTFVNTTYPDFAGAVLSPEPGGAHRLRFRDGTVWRFASGWLPRGLFLPIPGLGLLVEQEDRNGNRLLVTRDEAGAITRVTEPGGRSLLFTLELVEPRLARVTAVTDPLGRTVRYGYGATSPRRLETVTDPAGGVTRYTYDAAGHLLTVTDPRGVTFLENEHDPQGRVVRQAQADGGVWTFAYEGSPGAHTRAAVTDPRGFTTVHRMDHGGFAVETIDALGQTTRLDRDAGGRLIAVTDSLGRVTRLTYDTAGNVTAITDPAGHTRTFSYEATFNRVTAITDPLGEITRFEYDPRGNLTAVVDPLGARTSLAYDALGQLTTVTDALGNATSVEHDAVGNLVAVTDPVGHRTTRDYDGAGRLTRQADPRGKPTSFVYDALNRITHITDALGAVTRFTYDPNGNLLTLTDARGHTTSHAFDPMDRLAERTDPLGASEHFTYDRLGNLLTHTDRKGQVATFTYDALNRRTGAAYADGALTTFVYDAAGRLVEATDSAGGTITNQYDPLDRLRAQVTDLGTVAYEYDPLGRRTRMQAPGVPPVTYAYDTASRLTAVAQGPQVVHLEHDPHGRRTRLTLPNAVSTDYEYDAASRPTALTYRHAHGVLGDLRYTYDAAGNRTSVTGSFARTLLPEAVDSATYDAANRQLTFGDQAVTYDPNGNLIDDSTISYAWDARNRLITLAASETSHFRYDAYSRRTRTVLHGVTTDFVYDGLNFMQAMTDNTVVETLTGLALDEVFAWKRDSAGLVLLVDALGSTIATVAADGDLERELTYAPFGASPGSGSPPLATQFTGRENDGTGLYYYRARYYSPRLRRFISEDPIGFAGGDPNLYAYVRNNPVLARDPLGLIGPVGGMLVGAVLGGVSGSLVQSHPIVGAAVSANMGLAVGLLIPIVPPGIPGATVGAISGTLTGATLGAIEGTTTGLARGAFAGLVGGAVGGFFGGVPGAVGGTAITLTLSGTFGSGQDTGAMTLGLRKE